MGQSTDGILVFGVDFGEEAPAFLEAFNCDMDEYLASISGLPQWGETGHSFDADRKFREQCPADVTRYCSGAYPMYILSVRGTEHVVNRGYVEEIPPDTLASAEPLLAAFLAWCSERDIELPSQPKWLLASMWN